jgi:hypothetical protein
VHASNKCLSPVMVLPDRIPLSSGHASPSVRPGRYRRADPMFFSRGSSLKSRRWENANPTIEAPWVSVYWRSISAREPGLQLEELQHQPEPEPRRPGLVRQQGELLLIQRPALDQLFQLPLTPHLFSRSTTKAGRKMISNQLTTDRYDRLVITTWRTWDITLSYFAASPWQEIRDQDTMGDYPELLCGW